MTATHKIVNGVRVELTAKEKAAIEADWAAEAAAPKEDGLARKMANEQEFRALCEVIAENVGKTAKQIEDEIRAKIGS